MRTPCLFVTGMQRSGTTLLDRLLDLHADLSILSQPLPAVFLEAKRDFLRLLGSDDDPYPLGHLFLEDRYESGAFGRFLTGYRAEAAAVGLLFEDMAGFGGQYTRRDPAIVREALESLPPGDFLDAVSHLYRRLSTKCGARMFGGKETLCEEYLPYFLEHGSSCVLIIRDPRDVVASLNYGAGESFAGRLKPILFNLRNWRKSVAFAVRLGAHPRFVWLRYEDLVTRSADCLDHIGARLGLEPFGGFLRAGQLRDASGALWTGNSSHGPRAGISQESVGIHGRLLPPDVVAYVEAVCYPELRWLGYPVSLDWSDAPDVARSFRESYDIARPGLSGYSEDPVHLEQELRRMELLGAPASDATRPYFLLDGVHDELRRAVGGA